MTTAETEIESKLQTEVLPLLEKASAFTIKTAEDKNAAIETVKNLKLKWEELDARFRLSEVKEKAKDAHKAACNTFNAFKEPIDKAIDFYSRSIKDFELLEIKKREAEAKILEAQRQQTEREAKEKLAIAAKAEEESGNMETAQALREQAETIVAPIAFQQPDAAPAEGASSKVIWKAKVLNIRAVCLAIAKGDVPESVVKFSESELNKFAQQWHHKPVGGIQFYEDIRLSIRTK